MQRIAQGKHVLLTKQHCQVGLPVPSVAPRRRAPAPPAPRVAVRPSGVRRASSRRRRLVAEMAASSPAKRVGRFGMRCFAGGELALQLGEFRLQLTLLALEFALPLRPWSEGFGSAGEAALPGRDGPGCRGLSLGRFLLTVSRHEAAQRRAARTADGHAAQQVRGRLAARSSACDGPALSDDRRGGASDFVGVTEVVVRGRPQLLRRVRRRVAGRSGC